jgi:apolipoprotein N-acyltransferase
VPLVQPLICYESLYPGFSHAGPLALLPGRAPPRPAWIANVSNDAWFGRGSGPRQHLNLAAYRAIEEGLPMVRATPTGVSAFIDPYGRVLDDLRLDLGESGVIDGRLPAALPPTPYAVVGDGPFWLLLLLGLTPAWRRRHAMGKTIDASAP